MRIELLPPPLGLASNSVAAAAAAAATAAATAVDEPLAFRVPSTATAADVLAKLQQARVGGDPRRARLAGAVVIVDPSTGAACTAMEAGELKAGKVYQTAAAGTVEVAALEAAVAQHTLTILTDPGVAGPWAARGAALLQLGRAELACADGVAWCDCMRRRV